VYAFRYGLTRVWVQQAKITDPDGGEAYDGFGATMCLHNDVVFIGATGKYDDTGAVLVFAPIHPDWPFSQELLGLGSSPGDDFGSSVRSSSAVAAIGAMGAFSQEGAAYIFRDDGRLWQQEAMLPSPAVGLAPNFGAKVALSADARTLLVSAPADSGEAFEAGALWVYRQQPEKWKEVAHLTASNAGPGGGFGTSISISGDTAALGSSGHAYILAGILGIDCNGSGTPDACDIAFGGSQDSDGDGVPDECQATDINGDGIVDVEDLVELILAWGPCAAPCPPACAADVDDDCVVGATDLLILVLNRAP
jgi:hypothetical protein